VPDAAHRATISGLHNERGTTNSGVDLTFGENGPNVAMLGVIRQLMHQISIRLLTGLYGPFSFDCQPVSPTVLSLEIAAGGTVR